MSERLYCQRVQDTNKHREEIENVCESICMGVLGCVCVCVCVCVGGWVGVRAWVSSCVCVHFTACLNLCKSEARLSMNLIGRSH